MKTFSKHNLIRGGWYGILILGSFAGASLTEAGVNDARFSIESKHFKVTYDLESTAELAQQTSDELENRIWPTEIDQLGFKSPLRYEGDKFQVHIDDSNEELTNSKILGVTYAYSDGTIYIVMSETIEDWNTYINTLAHEFFHVIQYRYLSPGGENFQAAPSSSFESGATWIESEVYPEFTDYAAYMNVYFPQPEGSVFLAKRPGLSYWEYSLSIWVEWIEQTLGSHVIDNFWRELYALSQKGYNIEDPFFPYWAYYNVISWENNSILKTFRNFSVANINTSQTYEVGEYLSDARITNTYSNYPVENANSNLTSLFGAKYHKFKSIGTAGNLKVTLIGEEDLGYTVSLIPVDSSGKLLLEDQVATLIPVGKITGSVILDNADHYDHVIGVFSPVDKRFSTIDTSTEIFRIEHNFTFTADWTDELSTNQFGKIKIPSTSPYTDLTTSHMNYKAITYLSEKDVLEGYSDGTFKPSTGINRAEFFKILVASLDVEINPEVYKDCYPDVHAEWYAKYICYGTAQGWVEGYPDGTFKPGDSINKVEALKMLLESRNISTNGLTLLNYNIPSYTDTPEEEWYYPYLQIAYGLKLLEEKESTFNPNGLRTRSEVSEETFRLTGLIDANTVSPDPIFYSGLVDELVLEY